MALEEKQIKEKLLAFPGWELANGSIRKTYGLKDFKTAVEFVNHVAMIAENANHHPDINIQYSKVTFILSTHSENGITEKYFSMAKQIEQLVINFI
jgi:4a-hydroxytetrahydrobiopterin dehydratase